MIYLSFSINNPWYTSKFKNIWCKEGKVSKNKSWCLQFSYYEYDLFGGTVKFAWRGTDHAGSQIDITILGYTFSAQIYDNRHWDFENNCWETYEDEDST